MFKDSIRRVISCNTFFLLSMFSFHIEKRKKKLLIVLLYFVITKKNINSQVNTQLNFQKILVFLRKVLVEFSCSSTSFLFSSYIHVTINYFVLDGK